MDSILRFEDVSLTYQSLDAETHAIESLSLDVGRGEFVVLLGPSGCGKSSVLSLAAGLLRPSAGRVLLKGRAVECPSDTVGYMLQHDHLFEWRTILQNAMLGLEVRGKAKEGRARVMQLLKTYGLYDFRNQKPSALSGGMRQRAALIRTLAPDPEILLLDEPFAALDYQTRLALSDEIAGIIREERKTALFVTHDISEAISIADRVLVFTSRPAKLKREFPITLSARSPLARRNLPAFREVFDAIWKEMDIHVA